MRQAYEDYWQRIKLRQDFADIRRIPVKRWYPCDELNEIEAEFFNEMKDLRTIIDIGSGNNALKNKFKKCGYQGTYHTMDLSEEFDHDYHDLAEIKGTYEGIMILEVIEHMDLEEFMKLLSFIDSHLAPAGKLIISTTQPRSIIPWESWDMTHVRQYPLHDLYALLTKRGYRVSCYRVWTQKPVSNLLQRARLFLRKVLCYILGVDYADSIAVIARKAPAAEKTAGQQAGYAG